MPSAHAVKNPWISIEAIRILKTRGHDVSKGLDISIELRNFLLRSSRGLLSNAKRYVSIICEVL